MTPLHSRRRLILAAFVACAVAGLVTLQAQTDAIGIFTRVLLGTCVLRTGSGTPESAVTGNICDVYLRTNGGAATTLYVKESGTGNTGWVAIGASVGTHAALSATHTDTTAAAVQRGDLVTGQSASPTWQRLAKGAANTVLKSDGTDLSWSAIVNAMITDATITFAKWASNGCTTNQIPKINGSGVWECGSDASGAGSSNVLLDNGNHTDTTSSAVTKGDLVVGNSTPAWDDLPVGSNGQVLTADSGEATGLKWADAGAGSITRKSADESVTSSTSLQSDDHLNVAIGASETWQARWTLFVSGNTSGDINVALNVPASATGRFAVSCAADTSISNPISSLNVRSTSDLSDSGSRTCGTLTGTDFVMYVEAMVVNSTNVGNITLRWAQVTSNGTATTVLANSFVEARKVQ